MGSGRTGGPFTVTRDGFAQAMEDAKLSASIAVPDRLGDGESRRFALAFPSMKSFELKSVIQEVKDLAALLELANKVTKPGAVPVEQAAAEVERIVGPGRLSAAVAAALAPAAPAPAPAPSSSDGPVDVNSILDNPEVQKPTAKGAVDSFIGTMRKSTGSPSTVAKGARAIRDLIEDVVYGTAKDILDAREVARLEASWRGLKLLVDQCSPKSGMLVEVHDVPANAVTAALRTRPPAEEFDAPDAIFVPIEADSAALVAELADCGELANAPVIVGVDPALFGAPSYAELADRIDVEGAFDEWKEVRTSEATRWLTAVANRIVLRTEGGGSARRSVIGCGVWAMASMLAQSYDGFGSFARVVGAPGSLKSPGNWTLTSGKHEGISIPTEAFYSIRTQTEMGRLGITGLGSGRNDDKIILTEVRTVRSSPDAMPLPAQMLTGRIVRFARWVRDQVPSTATADDISQLFHQAADVFLFPGLQGHAHLEAGLKEDKGERFVMVHAKVRPEHALVPLDIEFGLPLE
jgi:type VI secretion system protein ImpC